MKATVTQFIAGAFGLIALFLVLAHYTGFSQVLTSGATGTTNVITALQGRS